MFICGSKGFSHEKDREDKNSTYDSPCQTPKAKRSKTSTSFRKFLGKSDNNAKIKNNPYADKGLDKFYELLAELDKQKQQIYAEKGSDDISYVRFTCDNDSKHVKPFVVRVNSPRNSFVNEPSDKIHDPITKCNEVVKAVDRKEVVTQKKRGNEGRFRLRKLRRPQYYFCMMIVLILVLLCMNDRSFAILCTLIGWYLCPTIIGERSSSSTRKPKRKKEYHHVKNHSEKELLKIVSALDH